VLTGRLKTFVQVVGLDLHLCIGLRGSISLIRHWGSSRQVDEIDQWALEWKKEPPRLG
jgi:hypothetical protein